MILNKTWLEFLKGFIILYEMWGFEAAFWLEY